MSVSTWTSNLSPDGEGLPLHVSVVVLLGAGLHLVDQREGKIQVGGVLLDQLDGVLEVRQLALWVSKVRLRLGQPM